MRTMNAKPSCAVRVRSRAPAPANPYPNPNALRGLASAAGAAPPLSRRSTPTRAGPDDAPSTSSSILADLDEKARGRRERARRPRRPRAPASRPRRPAAPPRPRAAAVGPARPRAPDVPRVPRPQAAAFVASEAFWPAFFLDFTLVFLLFDAGFSGDWVRIHAITPEQEELARRGAAFASLAHCATGGYAAWEGGPGRRDLPGRSGLSLFAEGWVGGVFGALRARYVAREDAARLPWEGRPRA